MPRLSVDIDEDLQKRLSALPWGVRKHVLIKLIEKACDFHEKWGEKGLGALLGNNFSLMFDLDRSGQNLAGSRKGKKSG